MQNRPLPLALPFMSLIRLDFFRRFQQRSMVLLALCASLCAPVFGQNAADTESFLLAKDNRNMVDLALSAQDRLSVADTVRGILSYARWPDESRALRLCVTGKSTHGDGLLAHGLLPLTQRAVTTLRVPVDTDIVTQCDALYVGDLDESSWRRLFSHIADKPVLTVCERSPICMIGGMFCLDVDSTASGVPFEVNLDSVARSGVRVNPQVLRLGRRAAAKSSS